MARLRCEQNNKNVINMEEQEIDFSKIKMEVLRETASKLTGSNKKDLKFAGVKFFFVDEKKNILTHVGFSNKDFKEEDYEK